MDISLVKKTNQAKIVFLEDSNDEMKLFSENHTKEYELPTVDLFMPF